MKRYRCTEEQIIGMLWEHGGTTTFRPPRFWMDSGARTVTVSVITSLPGSPSWIGGRALGSTAPQPADGYPPASAQLSLAPPATAPATPAQPGTTPPKAAPGAPVPRGFRPRSH